MLASLEARPADPLLSLIKLFDADPRPHKIDLGVGVFRDASGKTPVMQSVKAAEKKLIELQDSKSYLGPEGDVSFVNAMAKLAFGNISVEESYAGLQTPGGTGALRLLLELWQRANPDSKVWLGTPSWPVHETMIRRVGVQIQTYVHYDTAAQSACPDNLLSAIRSAKSGDLFLLHGCCHNPSGADPDASLWRLIAEALLNVGAIPLVDLAYQGLGNGLDEDATGLRILLDHLPELLLAYSCDMNFGLYRDRVGAAYVVSRQLGLLEVAQGHLSEIARSCWSMPPDHGAAVARLVMTEPTLTASWRQELNQMTKRIQSIRDRLAEFGDIGKFAFGRLRNEKGMFALLPATPDEVVRLRNENGISWSGRGASIWLDCKKPTARDLCKPLEHLCSALCSSAAESLSALWQGLAFLPYRVGFELGSIPDECTLSQNPCSQSIGNADVLVFGICDIRACFTKTPQSHRMGPLFRQALAALTYPHGYTQSLSLWQRRTTRRTTQPTC